MAADPDFRIKRGDTLPALTTTLKDAAGAPIDLTNVTTVTLLAQKNTGGTALSRACVKESPQTSGKVTYTFVTADWNAGGFTVGRYNIEWELVYSTGAKLTIPTDGYLVLQVGQDLG